MTDWTQYKDKRVKITTENLTVEGFVVDTYPWHHNDPVFHLDVSGAERFVVHLIEGAHWQIEDLTPVVRYKDLLGKRVLVWLDDTSITGILRWVFEPQAPITNGDQRLEVEVTAGVRVKVEVGGIENAYTIEEVQ